MFIWVAGLFIAVVGGCVVAELLRSAKEKSDFNQSENELRWEELVLKLPPGAKTSDPPAENKKVSDGFTTQPDAQLHINIGAKWFCSAFSFSQFDFMDWADFYRGASEKQKPPFEKLIRSASELLFQTNEPPFKKLEIVAISNDELMAGYFEGSRDGHWLRFWVVPQRDKKLWVVMGGGNHREPLDWVIDSVEWPQH